MPVKTCTTGTAIATSQVAALCGARFIKIRGAHDRIQWVYTNLNWTVNQDRDA